MPHNGYLLAQKGGYGSIGILKNDLYNDLHRKKHPVIKDGDARVALSYLEGEAGNDPTFYSTIETTSDGNLKHLFWVDGHYRSDFQCFGDVLTFDTTYRYDNPLVIFSGCNHHLQVCVFGCALLVDEMADTYK